MALPLLAGQTVILHDQLHTCARGGSEDRLSRFAGVDKALLLGFLFVGLSVFTDTVTRSCQGQMTGLGLKKKRYWILLLEKLAGLSLSFELHNLSCHRMLIQPFPIVQVYLLTEIIKSSQQPSAPLLLDLVDRLSIEPRWEDTPLPLGTCTYVLRLENAETGVDCQ